jgi:precorrin-4 C11-methyltransferase
MSAPHEIALIAVTRKGVAQARCLRERLRAGDLYRPARYGPATPSWESLFTGTLAEQVPSLFARYRQLVFFLAAGAVTRLIAPCLGDKATDPGVLAVDEGGNFVIPLLSGHKGGANAFARRVAGCLGAVPVVTTASDVLGGLSLDLLEDAYGWVAEPAGQLKDAALTLVNEEPTAIIQEIGSRGAWLDEVSLPEHVVFASAASSLPARGYAQVLWITDCVPPVPKSVAAPILWFRPKSLVLGVGCERGISLDALEDGLTRFLEEHGYARASIATLASVTLKANEAGLCALAERHGWQTVFYSPEELAAVSAMPNPSALVAACVGTPGVAEPAALRTAGVERLLVEKKVLASPLAPQRMTFALARLAQFQERAHQGKVIFVGAGPGDPGLLTLKARRALTGADVVIYAGSLVPEEILRSVPATTPRHNSAHLTLEQVLDIMLPAARAGQRVVRVHSGDPSLYGAIQEQIAVLEREEIEYEIIPGVSSFQAAAAALKSELTLPEVVQTVILTRAEGQTPMPPRESLTALAQHGATLCIFLGGRLVERIQEQLLTAYPPETPAALVYRVTWPDEVVVTTRLDQLAETARRHGMTRTTLILVGSAIGGRRNRSLLYDQAHGHIFRKRHREADHPPA